MDQLILDAPSNSLIDLAARIRAEHEAAGAAVKKTLQHCITSDALLVEAKDQLNHGQWLPYLREHCHVSERTARHYMRLFRHRDEIGNVADLTVREAVESLAGPKDDFFDHLLAAPSTPESARTEAERAESGEWLNQPELQEITGVHSPPPKTRAHESPSFTAGEGKSERRGLKTGVAMHPYAERGLDVYETPECAVRALLKAESLTGPIWEPACGPGAIVRVLREAGHKVIATDIADYGCPDSTGGVDFLRERRAPDVARITGPDNEGTNLTRVRCQEQTGRTNRGGASLRHLSLISIIGETGDRPILPTVLPKFWAPWRACGCGIGRHNRRRCRRWRGF
jgi:hypothetical protein